MLEAGPYFRHSLQTIHKRHSVSAFASNATSFRSRSPSDPSRRYPNSARRISPATSLWCGQLLSSVRPYGLCFTRPRTVCDERLVLCRFSTTAFHCGWSTGLPVRLFFFSSCLLSIGSTFLRHLAPSPGLHSFTWLNRAFAVDETGSIHLIPGRGLCLIHTFPFTDIITKSVDLLRIVRQNIHAEEVSSTRHLPTKPLFPAIRLERSLRELSCLGLVPSSPRPCLDQFLLSSTHEATRFVTRS